MNIDVYDHTNTTHQGTLTEAHGIEFLDDLTIPGFARFQLDDVSTAQLAVCKPRRVVRFRTGANPGDGDVFAAIIQDLPATLNDQVQPRTTGRISTVTVECRGLLAWLGGAEGGAVLYPFGGLEGRQQNPRVFGWQTQDFDDTGWGEVDTTMTGGSLSTPGFPDPLAVAFEPVFPGDRALYRRFLPALETGIRSARMYLAATVSTQVTVWLDGELVLEKPRGLQGIFFADVPYEDLDHQLAVEVTGGTGRWGWTWVELDPTDQATLSGDWRQDFFDDSSWDAPAGDGEVSTEGWPDADAVAYRAQGELSRFRRTIDATASVGATMTVVATIETRVRVWLDDVLVLEKPENQSGLFSATVDLPATGTLAVAVNGGGRWALTWQDTSDVTLLSTYDPAVSSPSNPWYWTSDAYRDEVTVGEALRRTYDPAVFPNADSPWLSYEGGPNDWQQPGYVADDSWVRPVADGPLSTAGWPDALAVGYFSDPGRGRFFRQITSTVAYPAAKMTVVAEVNTSVRLFVDNTQVALKPTGRRGLFEFDVPYPGQDFVLSAVVVGGGRWGLTWRDGSSVLRRTYDPETYVDADPWLYKPDDLPGVTTGFVLKTALDEDAGRHSRPWTYTFDGDADSDSQPYTVTFSRGFRVQEVGRLVDELTSIEGEPDMRPDGTLRWVVRRGEDRTSTVEVSSPFGLQLSGRGPQATRWLYETQSGFGQALTDGPEVELGVMERFVQLGSDISSQSIANVVAGQVAGEAQQTDEVQVELGDGVVPYVDCFLGDVVTCWGRDGLGPVRLNSFHGRVDDLTGRVEWTATGVPG